MSKSLSFSRIMTPAHTGLPNSVAAHLAECWYCTQHIRVESRNQTWNLWSTPLQESFSSLLLSPHSPSGWRSFWSEWQEQRSGQGSCLHQCNTSAKDTVVTETLPPTPSSFSLWRLAPCLWPAARREGQLQGSPTREWRRWCSIWGQTMDPQAKPTSTHDACISTLGSRRTSHRSNNKGSFLCADW